MIELDYENGHVLIRDKKEILRPSHINQLRYWGFKDIAHQVYLSTSPDSRPILLKVVSYLNKLGLQYRYTQSCANIVSELNDAKEQFQALKNKARLFKAQQIVSDEYRQFSDFINKHIKRTLKPHQIRSAFHLFILKNGANFSVPGSGKTSVILAVYEKLRLEEGLELIFVIGPPSCFGPWRREFDATLGRRARYRILAGGSLSKRKSGYYNLGSTELCLTTYQTLLNDIDEVTKLFQRLKGNVLLVVDEAHYIKQVNGRWSTAVLNLAKHVNYRCVLTGTPLPRSYTDLFNLFDFLWPHNSPLDSSTKTRIELCEKNNDFNGARQILDETVSPLFVRVKKSDLKLKPQKFKTYLIKMNLFEKTIYDAIDKNIRTYAKKDYLKSIDLISRLRRGRIMRLRQCTSYPKLLATSIENYREDVVSDSKLIRLITQYDSIEIPAKISFLLGLVEKFQEENLKVVIWAQFVQTLKLIKKHLDKKGYYSKMIFGETPIHDDSIREEETREKIRDEFVDPKSKLDILIANPAACAESISLHKTCQNAIYYDLSYNCAQYLQSLDRIHRVGGSEAKGATYHILQCENTIDQDMILNLSRKITKMAQVIDEDLNLISVDMNSGDDDELAYERLFSAHNP